MELKLSQLGKSLKLSEDWILNPMILEEDRDTHLQNVMQIILDNQSPEIGKIPCCNFCLADYKLTIAIYMRNFVRKIIDRGL